MIAAFGRRTGATAILLVASLASSAVAQAVCGTPGKDGPGGTLTGIVNTYFPGATGTAAAGATTITVGAATGASMAIAPGDLLLVMQMQDAQVNSTNTNQYGGANGSGAGSTAINNSGRYEYVTALSALGTGGGTVSIRGTGAGNGLLNGYTSAAATGVQGQRTFQVIRVPQYSSAAFSSGLTAHNWNGSTGGVLAVDVAGTLTLGGTVSVDGQGFRAGPGIQYTGGSGGTGTDYRNLSTFPFHGLKGEGIAGTPAFVLDPVANAVVNSGAEGYPNGATGQGAPGTAGGGGTDANPGSNDQNSGGGGGGNGGAGGKGGFSWSSGQDVGGRGGVLFAAAIDRVTFGGGGGAGARNNSSGVQSSGGAGGGIVMVRAGTVAGSGTISASGVAGIVPANDGGGGGGAGGSIVVLVQTGGLGGLTAQARGGNGSNADPGGVAHGPGGGGGGGVLVLSAAAGSSDVSGGTGGYTVTPGNTFGATNGSAGTILSNAAISSSPGTSASPLCVPSLTVTKTTSTPTVIQTPTGTTATYTIVATNAVGRDTARTVSLLDALPSGFTYQALGATTLAGGASRVSTSNPAVGATTPTFGVFSLPGGGSLSQTFSVAIPSTVVAGTFQNPATAVYLDPARPTNSSVATSNYLPASSTGEDVTVTAPNLKLTKAHSGSFTVGVAGVYTLVPSNAGTAPTIGTITVLDTLPAAVTFASATGTGWTCSAAGQIVTCTSSTAIAAAANGQPITLTVNVLPAAAPSFTNTAAVLGGGEPTAGNADNGASDPTNVVLSADLVTTKTGPVTASAGSAVTYTVTTVNNGPGAAATVVVVDKLPTTAPFVGASNGGTVSGTTVTWPSVASLASGGSLVYTVTVTAPASGTLGDTASSTSTTPDPTPANNNGSLAGARVTTVVAPLADLGITKTGPATANAGANITYTLTVRNTGPSAAQSVVTTDSLPAGATFVSATGGGTFAGGVVTFPVVASLANGATVSYTVTIAAPAGGAYTDVALVTSATADPATANNRAAATTTVAALADVVTRKTGPATAVAGTPITYTVVTTNNGPSAAQPVGIADSLATGVTFVSASNGGTLSGSVVFWPIVPSLASGATLTYTVTVTAAQAGTYTDVAFSSSSTTDPTPANNNGSLAAARASTVVSASADVSVAKTGPATVTAGATVTYTLTATNNGPSTATGVAIRDTLPVGATFVSATGGGTRVGTAVTWPAVASLATGASSSVTVTVTFAQGGTYQDIARVTTTTSDPNTANNRATFSTTVTASADVVTTKTGPATAAAGTNVAYAVRALNNGPSTATGIVISDQLPAGATFVAASNGGTLTGTTVAWPSIATLASGASITYTVTVRGAQPGTLTDVASSTSTSADPTPGNNDGSAPGATATTTITAVADLVATKTGPATAAAGTSIPYTVRVTNNGPSNALNVIITDTIPAAATFVSASNGGTLTGNVVTWPAVPSLATAANVAYTVTLQGTTIGSITNIVAATSPTADGNLANNRGTATTAITASADLSIITTGPATAAVGANVTYTLVATNNGPTAATNAFVRDTLPAGAVFVSASGGGTFAAGVVTFPVVATLANAGTLTYTVVVRYPAAGTFTDIGRVASASNDPNLANNRATAVTVVSPVADVATTKTGPATATAGASFTYTITATNAGPSPAAGVVLIDSLATGATFVSASNGGTLAGNVVTWPAVASLASGANVAYTVTVRAAQGGAYTDIAASTSTTPDPTPGNNNGSAAGARVTTTVTASANLVTTKAGPATGAAGSNLAYTVTVTNNGPSTALSVVVTDTIPAAATFVSASNGGTQAGTVVTWPAVATLASGANVSYTVTLRSSAVGSITNIAAATSATSDPTPANNRGTATTAITASADLSITNTGPATANAGTNVTYTLVATNNGPTAATNAVVLDTLPAGALFVSASGGGTFAGGVVTFPVIASLANGATATYTVVVQYPVAGTYTDIARVNTASPDPTPANNRATATTVVNGAADLATTKSGPLTGTAGANLTYTITTLNNGTSPATGIAVTDTLPVGVTFVAASNGGTAAGNVVSWPTVTTLANGASVAYTVTVTAAQAGTYTDIAASTSTTTDPTPSNNNGSAAAARVATVVAGSADLVVTKSGPASAAAASQVTYTVTGTNNGPSTAANVVLRDSLPAGVTFVSASNGGTASGRIVTWPTLATLANGAAVSYTVTAAVPATGTIVNVALGTSTTVDPTPGNNDGTAPGAQVVTAISAVADVSTSLSGPAAGTAGQDLVYSVTVRNNGPSTASTIVPIDTLPAGLTFVSATGGGTAAGQVITWPGIPTLATGATTTFTVTVRAADAGTYTSIAASTSGSTDPAAANNDGSQAAGRVTTVITASADLVTTKAGPTTATAGADITYTLTTLNSGPSVATGITVVDTLAAGVTFVSATNGGTPAGNVVTWPAVAALANGATLSYGVTVRAAEGGTYTDIAASSSTTTDPTPGNNNGSAPAARVTTTVTPSADVAITESGPATATAGTPFSYTITVVNNGPSTAQNVVPIDTLPAGLTFVSASNGGTQAGGLVTFPSIATLAPGATATYTVTVVGSNGGSFTNIVASTATTPDAVAANNNGSQPAARVTTVISATADLATTKTGPATATAGQDIVYTISTLNNGPSAATGVVVTDTLAAGLTFVSATNGGTQSGNVITWPAVASLASSGSLAYGVTVRTSVGGSYTDIAASTATTPDAVPGNNNGSAPAARVTTVVAASADVVTAKSGPTTAVAGSDITYTITTSNQGPSDAAGVITTDTLAAGVTFISASNGATQSGNVVTWPALPTLASATNVAYTVTVRASAGGSFTDIAASTATTPDPTPGNNNGSLPAARVTTTVSALADVATTESGPATATAGSSFSYTVTVTNNGPSAAQNVVVIDTLPAGLVFVSASGGGFLSGGIVTFPVIPSLAPGATATYTVSVVGNNGGTFTNIVASNAATADPTSANNNGSQPAARVTTVIGAVADVVITKSGPATGVAGADLAYSITARNAGPSAATTVAITDTLPTGLTFVSATNGGTALGNVVSWPAVASLANGASVTYGVTARGTEGGTYTDIAASTSATPDPTPGNNNGTAGTNRVTTTLTGSADVAVSKTGPAAATAGAALTYVITATNGGPSTATGVTLTDTLPAGLTFVSATNGGTLTGSTVTWPTVATLANGANLSYTVVARAAAGGTYVNVAAATTTSADPTPANNRATQSTVVAASADVAIIKTGPATAVAGQNITYTVATTNVGPSAAVNVVVIDSLPAGTAFVSASNGGLLAGGVVTWPVIGSLANGSTASFTVTLRAPASGTIINVASSSSTTPDPDGANNRGTATTAITASADLALSKTGPATATAGSPISYTIAVVNNGPSAATNVVVTDTLPAGVTFASASNGGTQSGNVVTWPAQASLASAATLQYTVTFSAALGGSYTDVADVSSPTADPTPANNRGSATTTVSASADLVTTKAGPATATAGGDILYTISTVNNGPSPAANVAVTDTVPAGATFVSATGGGSFAGGVVTWPTVASLANGATQSVTVTLRSTQGGNLTNVAASTSTTPDPSGANNRATAVTAVAATADVVTTKSGPGSAAAGTQITYTITTVNNGPSAAAGVVVRDSLPAGATFVSATDGGTQANGIVTWPTVASLANGATLTYSVIIRTPGVGPITNVAKSASTTADPTPGNNDGSLPAAQVVTAINQLADVITSKTGPARVDAGGRITYTIVSKNVGPSPAQSVVITDQLPAGVTFVSATNGGALAGGSVTWPTIATLALNDSVAYQLVVTAPTSAAAITNIVRSTAGTPDPVPGNNDGSSPTGQVVTQVSPVDLAIAKSHVGNFGTGTVATYAITVNNVSTVATTGPITVTDSLPAGLTFRSGTGTGWSCAAAGQIVSCGNTSTLAPAATTSIALQVNVGSQAAASVTNVATVSTPGDTLTGGNNRATDATTILPINPLAIQKSASKTEVEIADVVDYTVQVKNLSASPIPDVLLDDVLPKGFTYQRLTARADLLPLADPTGAPGPKLSFSLGTLAGNQTLSVTYRARVGAGAAQGDGTNRAIARSTSTQARSTVATATVKVVGGVFTDRGYIIGKVYADCDCDGDRTQSREDIGIPGVRVFLEDGTSAVTDVEGKYNFYGVTPRTHVVKVDPTTIPLGGHLVTLASRNLGDAGSWMVDLTNGELHKADFAVAFAPEVLAVIKARRERGEVYGAIIDTLAGTDRPAGIDDEPAPIGADRPVVPVVAGSDTMHTAVYRPIGAQASAIDETNRLPVTRLASLPVAQVVAPMGSIEVTPARRSIPADGNTAIAVRVRVLDRNRTPDTGDRTVTLEASLGRWLVQDLDPVEPGIQARLTNGEGQFTLVAANQAGVGEIRATSELLASTVPVAFIPAVRPLLVNGLIEGRIDLRSLLKDGVVPVSSTDRFDRELSSLSVSSDSGKLSAGVRSAMFLRGKIKGSTLLTLAYDTERDADKQTFRDIQPDAYYPVYGDASIKEFGAQSFNHLYVRVDNGRSFGMYGDYVTPNYGLAGAQAPRQLGAYNRTLTGALGHVEGKDGQLNVFASRDRMSQVVDELPGRGISGPYQLSRTDGRLNTEQVELVTRDRNQPARIIKSVPMTRFTDYTVEAFTGRLLFFAPVPSVDQDLNPVSIRVTYEVENTGGGDFMVYGADGQLRLGNSAEVGGSMVRDDDPLNKKQLYSLNATARLAPGTVITGEVARTDGDSAGATGNAGRLEIRHSSARFSAQAWGIVTDSGFSNASSAFQRGRAEVGMRSSITLDAKTRILDEFIYSEDRIGGGHRTGGSVSLERQFGEWIRAELGYRYAKETGLPAGSGTAVTPGATPNETSAIRSRLTFRVPGQPRASFFGEFEQDIQATDQRRVSFGGEYVLMKRLRLYARHEMLNSFAGAYALNGAQNSATTVVGLDAGYTKDGTVFSEYRARDAFSGREAEAAMGLRNRWHLARGVTANTSFERVHILSGTGLGEATAVTAAIEYTANPLWRATARFEYRFAPTGDNLLATLGYSRKLSRDWTLLGRGLVNTFADGGVMTRNQLGLAWRQTDRNRWNGLLSVQNQYQKLSPNTSAMTMDRSTTISAHLNWQPVHRFWLTGHYAGKWATDSSNGLRSVSTAQLGSMRALVDIGRRWDAGVIGSVLWSDGFANRQYGLGLEAGRTVITNLRLAAGYNFFGFRNPNLVGEGYTDQGVYVKFGFKFDENLFKRQAMEAQR